MKILEKIFEVVGKIVNGIVRLIASFTMAVGIIVILLILAIFL